MLAKNQRLNLKLSFRFVASGKRLETDLYKIFYQIGENKHPLVGISLSKSVSPHATDRNRARRLASTAIQALYKRLPDHINIVIMPKKTVLALSSGELTEQLQQTLKNAKLLA